MRCQWKYVGRIRTFLCCKKQGKRWHIRSMYGSCIRRLLNRNTPRREISFPFLNPEMSSFCSGTHSWQPLAAGSEIIRHWILCCYVWSIFVTSKNTERFKTSPSRTAMNEVMKRYRVQDCVKRNRKRIIVQIPPGQIVNGSSVAEMASVFSFFFEHAYTLKILLACNQRSFKSAAL